MHVYHVTPTRNVFDILEQGLLPSIGPRSQELGEELPRIYVFTRLDALEDALSNWLGEAFDEDEPLSIPDLLVDDSIVTIPENLYEAYIMNTLSPGCIVQVVGEGELGLLSQSLQSSTPRGNSPGP